LFLPKKDLSKGEKSSCESSKLQLMKVQVKPNLVIFLKVISSSLNVANISNYLTEEILLLDETLTFGSLLAYRSLKSFRDVSLIFINQYCSTGYAKHE
jgi:hypothetical protein